MEKHGFKRLSFSDFARSSSDKVTSLQNMKNPCRVWNCENPWILTLWLKRGSPNLRKWSFSKVLNFGRVKSWETTFFKSAHFRKVESWKNKPFWKVMNSSGPGNYKTLSGLSRNQNWEKESRSRVGIFLWKYSTFHSRDIDPLSLASPLSLRYCQIFSDCLRYSQIFSECSQNVLRIRGVASDNGSMSREWKVEYSQRNIPTRLRNSFSQFWLRERPDNL